MYIEETLIKANECLFDKKLKNCEKNVMKFRKKSVTLPKKEFENSTIYNEKYIKTKTKSYNGKINTNFHNNKIPKEGFQL